MTVKEALQMNLASCKEGMNHLKEALIQTLVCALYEKGYSIENDVNINNSSLEDKRKEYEKLKAKVQEMKEMYGFED